MNKIIVLCIFIFSCAVTNAQDIYKKFVVSSELLQKYKVNYPKLTPGMTKEKVKQLMGKPHVEENLMSKKGDDQGSALSYYIVRNHPDLVNEKHDKVIHMFFNVNEKLDYVTPKNIEGFQNIGSLSATATTN